MVKLVDANTGKVVEVGQRVECVTPYEILSVRDLIFIVWVRLKISEVERWVQCPVKWWPRLTYGVSFPTSGRTAIIPS
jgi:hypothetical protein